jgi:uncharacterized membrane protein
MSFKPKFAGTKNVYLYGAGAAGNSGWQTLGTWVVPVPAAPVTAVSVTPSSGTGATQLFNLRYSDSAGAADFTTAWVWFNLASGNAADSCMVYYNRPLNTLNLLNDAGNAWMPPALAGTTGSLSNSQCTVDMASTTVVLSLNDLVLNLAMSFKPKFAGTKNVYLYGAGAAGNSGWQTLGTWVVPAPATPVAAVSVTPSSGTGATQLFSLRYSDSAGAADFATAWVWFNLAFSNAPGSCMVYYNRPLNTLNLLNDAGNAWMPLALAGTAALLSNSQCTVDMASSTVTLSGTDLVLNLAMTFKPMFAGSKNVYMYAAGSSANSGWQTRGAWTVP